MVNGWAKSRLFKLFLAHWRINLDPMSRIDLFFSVSLVVHWVVMTGWVVWQQTEFCNSRWEERLYHMVVGLIYCFCFFSLKEGRSRHRLAAFQVGLTVSYLFLKISKHETVRNRCLFRRISIISRN